MFEESIIDEIGFGLANAVVKSISKLSLALLLIFSSFGLTRLNTGSNDLVVLLGFRRFKGTEGPTVRGVDDDDDDDACIGGSDVNELVVCWSFEDDKFDESAVLVFLEGLIPRDSQIQSSFTQTPHVSSSSSCCC